MERRPRLLNVTKCYSNVTPEGKHYANRRIAIYVRQCVKRQEINIPDRLLTDGRECFMFFSCRKSSGIAKMDDYTDCMDGFGRTHQTPIDGMSAGIEWVCRVTCIATSQHHSIRRDMPYQASALVSGVRIALKRECRTGRPHPALRRECRRRSLPDRTVRDRPAPRQDRRA